MIDKDDWENFLTKKFDNYEVLRSEIIKFQHEINDNNEKLYSEMSKKELEEKLADAKMAIFRLWYLAYTEKKYDL